MIIFLKMRLKNSRYQTMAVLMDGFGSDACNRNADAEKESGAD